MPPENCWGHFIIFYHHRGLTEQGCRRFCSTASSGDVNIKPYLMQQVKYSGKSQEVLKI